MQPAVLAALSCLRACSARPLCQVSQLSSLVFSSLPASSTAVHGEAQQAAHRFATYSSQRRPNDSLFTHIRCLTTSSAASAAADLTPKVRPVLRVSTEQSSMEFVVLSPTWETQTNQETGLKYRILDREGVVLLTMALPLKDSKATKDAPIDDAYDWDNKINIGLKAIDLGSVLSVKKGGSVELYHDTNKANPALGAKTKILKVVHNVDGSYSLSLTASQANVKSAASGKLTAGQVLLLRSAVTAAVPHLLGFDAVMAAPQKIVDADHESSTEAH